MSKYKNLSWWQRDEAKRLKEIIPSLIDKILSSKEEYLKFLEFHAKLYKYSFEDTLLIYYQDPTATAVATKKEWQHPTIGRDVPNSGVKAIRVLRGDSTLSLYDLKYTIGRDFNYGLNEISYEEELKLTLDKNDISKYSVKDLMELAGDKIIKTITDIYENEDTEKNKQLVVKYSDFIFCASSIMIANRFSKQDELDLDVASYIEEFQDLKNETTEEKIKILSFVQEIAKPVIMDINKEIRTIRRENILNEEVQSDERNTKQTDPLEQGLATGERNTGFYSGRRVPNIGGDIQLLQNESRRTLGSDVGKLDVGERAGTDAGADGIRGGRQSANTENSRTSRGGDRELSLGLGAVLGEEEPSSDKRGLYSDSQLGTGETSESLGVSPTRGGEEDLPLQIGQGVGEKLSKKTKFRQNHSALKIIKNPERDKRMMTKDEIEDLKSYSGFGSLPQVFDENNKDWQSERQQLKFLLSPEEYENLKASTLSAHYTPSEIAEAIYMGLENFGVFNNKDKLKLLEPSMGRGVFFENLPKHNSFELYGVELDTIIGIDVLRHRHISLTA